MTKNKKYAPNLTEDDIVISGMSGRFPESDTTDEFAMNLYNKVDMVTVDDRRWPTDLYGMNARMAKLKVIDRFDGPFFGIMPKMGDHIEPHARLLLETTYEAIVDAGLNPQTIRGSDTGVYIGYSSIGMPDGVPEELQPDSQSSITETLLWYPGTGKCLYANRLSFAFDFKGPSMVIDTACSSSMVALNIAVNDLRLGVCEQAIVGGTNINLQPFTNHIYQSTHINSRDGLAKVWDEKADGFVRGETVACIFLQRKACAKRIYATVLHTRTNIDGNKKMGMFFPSSKIQEELMIKTYTEANLDPLEVNYFEAHGTGTEVGDPQESKAIYNAYCAKPNRTEPLPIGLLKSNVGHSEAASGVSSIIKVLMAFENECIPANLHLNHIKQIIADMCPPLQPVTDNMAYTPGIAAVNNFGVGGVNGHVLLEPNYRKSDENCLTIADKMPRIVNICCRTEESLNNMFDFIEKNPNKISRDFLALLTDTMKVKPQINSTGFPYRGTLLIKSFKDDNGMAYKYKRQSMVYSPKNSRSLWFLFAGLGGQWSGMAKALMPIDIFADKIEECHRILTEFEIDLKHLLLSEDKNTMSSMTNKFCATTALQIAMIDVLHKLDIRADGIIGHSFGEIACAYADGCLSTREALLVTYIRGQVTESDPNIPKGLMAVIGMSWEETNKVLPIGVHVVCNNSDNSVVVSGLYNETKEFIQTLVKNNVFVRELESSQIPYHSQYLQSCSDKMIQKLKHFIPNPKLRSNNWISTSVLDSNPTDEQLNYASPEYFVHNLISPVYFHNKLQALPKDAIVLEVGPHSLFSKIVPKTLEESTYLSLINRNQSQQNLETLLTTIGKLYELGLNPAIEHLYPKVEWPVARNTQSISSLVEWQHNDPYCVRKYPDFHCKFTASDMNETIDISKLFDSYLPDHCIDGNIIFPATGYLMLAWRQLAASKSRIWNQLPVVFEDIQFRRPVFLSEFELTKLKVRLHESTGEFVVLENNNTVCFGRIYTPEEDQTLRIQNLFHEQICNEKAFESTELNANEIYKEFRIQGYDYGSKFKGLVSLRNDRFKKLYGRVEWNGNWVTFLDALLQSQAIAIPFRKMLVPVMISSLRCDPKVFFKAIEDYKVMATEEKKSADQMKEEFLNSDDLKAKLDSDEELGDNESEVQRLIVANNAKYIEDLIDSSFHKYKAILPFFVDITSRFIVTPGLEVEDLLAVPIPRKTNVQHLKLETYEFVANYETDTIDKSLRHILNEYIEICTSMANKIKNILALNEKITVKYNEELIGKYLKDSNESHVLLRFLNNFLNKLNNNNNNNNNNNCKESIRDEMINDLYSKPEYDLHKDIINKVSKNERFIRPLLDIISENNSPKREIKVLELNISNAIMATEVDSHLASAAIYPIDVDYTIAVKSLDDLSDEYKNKSFKLCEWSPKSTVFPSDITAIDLVIFRDCFDLWDLKLEDQLQDIYDAIVCKGFLLSIFRHKFTEPELALNQMNGRKETNNWRLERRIDTFIKTVQTFGLSMISRKTDPIGFTAILWRKVVSEDMSENINYEKQFLFINNDYMKWFETLKERLNQQRYDENADNLWLIANDSSINGIIGLTNSLRLEPGGDKIRCIFDYSKQLKHPFNTTENPIIPDILSNDLAINVIKEGTVGTYRHLSLAKDWDQIETQDYFLNVGLNRDLSSLQWFDSTQLAKTDTYIDMENHCIDQVRCSVYMAGLNFRDVLLASGKIISGPESLFTDCLIGFEFAGRRTDSGERVFGFNMSRCIATFVDMRQDLMTNIPEHWSMEDAITVLTTYSTVWYGLIDRAQLKQNESILIHSGAGGVGQAAIAICQHYGCDIYTTVGNDEKKKFLTEKYKIPENRIFNSRDIQFKYQIMSATNGKGVNLVLNSLTGEKLEASLKCVSDNGRFVEIGKYDMFLNKRLGMFAFLRNISFIGVSLDRVVYLIPGFAKKFFDWMHQNCTNGCIKPINRTVFKPSEAEQAFRYMTTGKHIGKIIIKIREEEKDNKPLLIKEFNSALKLDANIKTYFDSNKVFIITGGLGGLGLELLNWMVGLNARKFVLTSRHGIKDNYQTMVLDRLKSLGEQFRTFETQIVVSNKDCLTEESTEKLIKEALVLGPIGGVFHLALVLNDCLLENQTVDQFAETTASKVNPCLHLDALTRRMTESIDYFVVFSSVSCGKGNTGQTNYSFANSVVERVCEARRADGLHGLAIQWGPIGDVGVIADTDINSSFSGIVKQRINSCLEVLDKFLQCPQPILASTIRSTPSARVSSREARIIGQIWGALGIDPNTTPDHLTLGEIGIESMFAVELQQGLDRDYNIKVSLTDIKSITVREVKDFESGKIEELRKFAEDVRVARDKLTKIKFIIPTDSYSRLNSHTTGKPLYFLPPIEGIFSALESLAKRIDRPVIGLNWTQHLNQYKSIKEISSYYMDVMTGLAPKGQFDIIGSSFGAILAVKMIKRPAISRAIIIDVMSNTRLEEDMISDDYILSFVIKLFAQNMPKNLTERIIRDLNSVKTFDEKLNKISTELKEFGGKNLISKDLDQIVSDSFYRAKMFTLYRLRIQKKFKNFRLNLEKKFMQMSGKLLVIKPLDEELNSKTTTDAIDQTINESLFLPQNILNHKLKVELFRANPEDLSMECYDKMGQLINDYLLSK